jgi:hypothetical protein
VFLRSLPGDGAGPLDWLVFGQSGVLTSRQAVEALGRGKVRGKIGPGTWRCVCRGVLLTENGRLGRDQQLWVAVPAAGPGAVLAGATAVAESGVRGLRSGPLQVLVPAERRTSAVLPRLPLDMPGVQIRRTTILPPEHRQIGRPPRTAIARSVVDAAAWARTDDEARTVIAAACQQRRVMPVEISDVLGLLPRIRRRGLICTTVADVAGGAEALSEIDFVALCRRFGLPRPDLQQARRDVDGRNRYLDAYWREWHLHAEVDGAHHMDVRHWAADMRRQNQISTASTGCGVR